MSVEEESDIIMAEGMKMRLMMSGFIIKHQVVLLCAIPTLLLTQEIPSRERCFLLCQFHGDVKMNPQLQHE